MAIAAPRGKDGVFWCSLQRRCITVMGGLGQIQPISTAQNRVENVPSPEPQNAIVSGGGRHRDLEPLDGPQRIASPRGIE